MLKDKKYIFNNRKDAAKRLISVLPIENMSYEIWSIVAISFGAIPIAIEIAKSINADFDLMYSKKIFAAQNKECEIAIVTESSEVIIHEELTNAFGINLKSIYKEALDIYNKDIVPFVNDLKYGNKMENLNNKNILLVDEGLNTGFTMMACIKTAIALGAKSVSVATPILPEVTVGNIELIADDLYCVYKLDHFVSIDFYYKKFEDIDEIELKKIMKDKYVGIV